MPDTLSQLEKQRAQVVQDIAGLGDFRRGSITSITARCGKAHCACHQPGHPGHGPNFRLTRKVQGKTVSETFSPGGPAQGGARGGGVPPLSGAECEPGGGERKDLPVASAGGGRGVERVGKKTAEAIQQEIGREVKQLLRVILRDRRKTGLVCERCGVNRLTTPPRSTDRPGSPIGSYSAEDSRSCGRRRVTAAGSAPPRRSPRHGHCRP